jgi:hypothetical protein
MRASHKDFIESKDLPRDGVRHAAKCQRNAYNPVLLMTKSREGVVAVQFLFLFAFRSIPNLSSNFLELIAQAKEGFSI